jgi:hypothetical protein
LCSKRVRGKVSLILFSSTRKETNSPGRGSHFLFFSSFTVKIISTGVSQCRYPIYAMDLNQFNEKQKAVLKQVNFKFWIRFFCLIICLSVWIFLSHTWGRCVDTTLSKKRWGALPVLYFKNSQRDLLFGCVFLFGRFSVDFHSTSSKF